MRLRNLHGFWAEAALVVLVSMAVGWPALQGGYLSGDDENLIFNHGLVNRPSPAHAAELFRIVHRDLYQPLPLLTFQLEFAWHGRHAGVERLVRGMHLTNLLIHALNGVLVLLLFRQMLRRPVVPVLCALLFVCHPLAVECYAWLNGRIMMLSATFTLAALLAALAWRRRTDFERSWDPRVAGWLWAAAIACCAVLAMVSKVQPGLIVLLALVVVWSERSDGHGLWRLARSWNARLLFSAVLLLTVAFTIINIHATAESRMFEGAENQLHGPSLARVCRALSWYAAHYIWPQNLAPWYAPPKVIAWSDPEVRNGLLILALCTVLAAVSLRWSGVGMAGGVWFLAAVAATLPIVPARNLLVADRYVYLPNAGLHWILASILVAWAGRGRPAVARTAGVAAAAIVLAAWALISRGTIGYYHDDERHIARMIAVSPEASTLLTSAGWHLYEQGDYAGAIEKANEEIERFPDDALAHSRALSLRGLSKYRMTRDFDAARADLRAAVDLNPEDAKACNRLGQVCYEAGRLQEAEVALLRAIDLSEGQFNPAVKLLAQLYRRAGRFAEAAALYERAVANSKGFDAQAIDALGGIDIQQGRYEQAVQRYEALLEWHEHTVEPRLNLAAALAALGRFEEAAEQCTAALELDPQSYEARFNLALLHEKQQQPDRALNQYRAMLLLKPQDRPALQGAALILRRRGRVDEAWQLWARAAAAEPDAADLWAGAAYQAWFGRDLDQARAAAERAYALQPGQPDVCLSFVLLAMSAGQPQEVFRTVDELIQARPDDALCQYAYEAAEFQALVDPESPWPYHVTAVLLAHQGRTDVARQVQQDFDRRCSDAALRERLGRTIEQLAAPQSAPVPAAGGPRDTP